MTAGPAGPTSRPGRPATTDPRGLRRSPADSGVVPLLTADLATPPDRPESSLVRPAADQSGVVTQDGKTSSPGS